MDYFDRINIIKREIIEEICSLIEGKGLLYFDCPFVVHYQYDFPYMSKQACYSVRNNNGTLSVLVSDEESTEGKEIISGEDMLGYTSESLVKILHFVKSTLQDINARKFRVKITASRVLSVTAKSYEEASQIAMENLKKQPFDEGDIDCTEAVIEA